jgi:hypothetical protein
MNTTLKLCIETILKSKRGFEFEKEINQIYLTRYGALGYSPTRERRDAGSDGIIPHNSTIVATYGPDAYKKKDFEKRRLRIFKNI